MTYDVQIMAWLGEAHMCGGIKITLSLKIYTICTDNANYYIDRCELWRFIREINSDISHVKYQFFPTRTTFRQL